MAKDGEHTPTVLEGLDGPVLVGVDWKRRVVSKYSQTREQNHMHATEDMNVAKRNARLIDGELRADVDG